MADILSTHIVVNLDITIWTGQAKLKRTEIDDSNLPPDELVTLGNKRLFDPKKLAVFRGIKSAAFGACNRYGVRFLSGWLVDPGEIDHLLTALMDYKANWDRELMAFVSQYSNECNDWIAQNPQWENILRNSMPNESSIASKFNFGWQTFQVMPAQTISQGTSGDQMQDELDAIPTRAMEKLAREIAQVVPAYADGKTFKTAPLKRLAGLCDAVSFAAPEVSKLAEVMRELAAGDGVFVPRMVLETLSDAKKIAELCRPDATAENVIDDVVVATRPPVAPEPVQEPEVLDADELAGGYHPLPDADYGLLGEAQKILNIPVAEEPKPVDNNSNAVANMLGVIDSEGLW